MPHKYNTRSDIKLKHSKYAEESEDEEDSSSEEIIVMDNKIYFYTDITGATILKLRTELQKMINSHEIFAIKNDCNPLPIKLYINSCGGEVSSALIIVDLILKSKVPIYTIIEGEAASAATLISVVGHKRYITEHSHMLIHQIRGGIWGKMTEFEDEMKNMKMYSEKLIKIYKKYTNLTEEKLTKILKKEREWSSKKCKKYGLVDEII
jgi:ATP-dependent Clp protease, protease subunit